VKLSECVELYIDMKHANGHPYTHSAGRLRAFAKKTGDVQLEAVRVHDVVRFIERPGTSLITQRFKYGLLRNFFLHCKGRYPMGNVPMPPRLPSAPPSAFVPRVYSRAEIRALLRAIEPAQSGARCMIPARTFRTFLLFLYATGALLREAHQMLQKDVDLKRKRITIRGVSFDRVRTLPIGFDLCRILASYIGYRNRQKTAHSDRLFVDKSGQSVHWRTMQTTFRRVRRIAGLSSENIPYPPRMQDLRNAFVVHRLSAWSKHGVDLRGMVPPLAAYMGMVGLTSTERYLRLTPERFRRQLNILSPRRGGKRWGDDPHLMRFLAQL
jgi:integrase